MLSGYQYFSTSVFLIIIGVYLTYKVIIENRNQAARLHSVSQNSVKDDSFSLLILQSRVRRYIQEITEIVGISSTEIWLEVLMKLSLIGVLPLLLSLVMNLDTLSTLLLISLSSVAFIFWLFGYRKRLVKRYRDEFEMEFADFIESLSLAVNSGLPFLGAVSRVIKEYENFESFTAASTLNNGKLWFIERRPYSRRFRNSTPITRELGILKQQITSGESGQRIFDALASRICSSSVSNFSDVIAISLTRGTPLAAQLSEYALSLREVQKRSLLERAGRAEVKMMVPVVFLLLPISVLFALWPSFQQLQRLVITP